jgi:hypothetical protein
MILISRTKSGNLLRGGMMMAALALAGCNREGVKVQEVPKESDAPQQQASTGGMDMSMNPHGGMNMNNPHAGMDMGGMGGMSAQPKVKWTLPSGWQEKPVSDMRVGSFDAKGADVSIIPLPSGGPQMELGIYNMWRGELQLPQADKVDSTPVTMGSEQGKLYDMSGGKPPGRILVAAVDRDGMSWFVKMRGEESVVQEQKPAFLEFVKSLSFEAPAAPSMGDSHPTMGNDAGTTGAASAAGVTLPDGWKEIPNPPMLTAKYVIQNGDARADVNISMLNGTGGGLLMNVNRWRGQLGLAPITEEDFSKQATSLDLAGGKGTVVDMTGTDGKTGKKARLIGVVAPQGGETWFYKLMGDEQIVEQQKDAFTKFIQTAKFSNAP